MPPQKIMDLKKIKTLALVAVAAGLATQPVVATGNLNVAEDNYYVRNCGGDKSCGGAYPKPYNQTNPAPVAVDDKTQTLPPGQAPVPSKNGIQPPAAQQGQGQKQGSTTSRYYQKRDRDVADNAPNFSPSNGLLPDQQKGNPANKSTTGKSSTGSNMPGNIPSSSSNSGYSSGSGSSSSMNSGR